MYSKRQITNLARELRRRSTPAEKILWHELRNRKFHGVKFFRQHPVIYEMDRGKYYFFIPDFYSAEQKLVIELDGLIHGKQKYYDQQRDLVLEGLGLRVIRFKNEELRDLEGVKKRIESMF
ncbi:MAG: endonuclease domain-containing protein [Balneolaceae bacterium]